MINKALIDNMHETISSSHNYYDGCFKLIKNKGSYTLWLCGLAVLRFQEKKDLRTVSIADKYYKNFGLNSDDTRIIKQQANWTTILHTEEIDNIIARNIVTVFNQCFIDGATDIFGCCSRYEDCSNRKSCTHPDKETARGCMYKVNLDSGRIFYGNNCNID